VLIFTSDNGYLMGEHRLNGKSAAYEEAIRVPLFVRLPLKFLRALGGTSVGYAPRSVDSLVLNNDMAPTIAHLTGVTVPGADGRTIVPLLQASITGSAPPPWRKRFLVEHWMRSQPNDVPTYAGVRTGPLAAAANTMYLEYYDQDANWVVRWDTMLFRELYNLGADRFQLQSVSNHPLNASLSATLRSLRLCGSAAGQQPCAPLENA
jgi:arylsulfatase A-like enzyme